MQKNIRNPNWWRRRITLQKCLIIIFVLLAIKIAEEYKTSAIAGGRGRSKNVAGSSQSRISSPNSKRVVQNPAKLLMSDAIKPVAGSSQIKWEKEQLQRTANEVSSRMNRNEDPCNNFYKFACGNYIKQEEIPRYRKYIDEDVKLEIQVLEKLKNAIAEERPKTDPNYLKLPNLLYKACMNEKLIEDMGVGHYKKILSSLGGWPVVVGESWNKDNKWSWQETIKQFRRLGFSTDLLFTVLIDVNVRDPTKHIIELTGFERHNSQYPFISYYTGIAKRLGAKENAVQDEMGKSLNFEFKLKAMSEKIASERKEIYNPKSIQELQESYPYVDWLDYINALLPEGTKVNNNEIINLRDPAYFYALGRLLADTSVTPRVLANYMISRIFEVEFAPRANEMGNERGNERWMYCTTTVSDWLEYATGSLYVRKYFSKETKTAVSKMFKNIRDRTSKAFNEVDWMDQKTRNAANTKLHGMQAVIGYPEELLDDAKLEEYHSKLQIDPTKFTQTILDMKVFFEDKYFNKLRLPATRNDWTTSYPPQLVKAVYERPRNRIVLTAALLQGHYFNALRPEYMNYAAIGSVIAQIIIHAFDQIGRRYGPDGQLDDWWQSKTEEDFNKKAKCIAAQYSDMKGQTTGLNVKIAKIIAYNAGFKLAHAAYNQYVAKNVEEPQLPGLERPVKQIYWIAAAQIFCAKHKEGIPDGTTVNGALQNIEDFSTAFQCPKGSPMNPVHKCKVW